MNDYKVIATGIHGEHTVTAIDEKDARREFRARHKGENVGDIHTVTLIRENVPATKAQEREALEKIKAIVATLGPRSYIGTALTARNTPTNKKGRPSWPSWAWRRTTASKNRPCSRSSITCCASHLKCRRNRGTVMYKNIEGYADPTAGEAMANVGREERQREAERLAAIGDLMPIIRQTAALVGFEIVNRITFRDKTTGREYR